MWVGLISFLGMRSGLGLLVGFFLFIKYIMKLENGIT